MTYQVQADQRGFGACVGRPPMPACSPAQEAEIRKALEGAGLL